MINFLFLLATAQASDIYEVCRLQRQEWVESKQVFETKLTQVYYVGETVQFIFHRGWFEVDKKRKNIDSVFEMEGRTCWQEHANSEICFDEESNILYWEFHKRNGDVLRDKMDVCRINGESVR